MTVSQNLESLPDTPNGYIDTITVTDIPKGFFIAITSNTAPADGETTRQMQVTLMQADWADGGTHSLGSGVYIRKDGETAVCVKVEDGNGAQQAENTTDY